jgi:hypothetical protein
MADRFGQLRKFVIGFGTLKPWKVRRRMRFSRSAAQGILGSNLFFIHSIHHAGAHCVRRSPHPPLAL